MATKRLLFGNKAIHQMLGYTPEELMALAISDILPQEDLPAAIEAFAAMARGEIELTHDLPVLRKDGSVFYANISSFRLNSEGTPTLVARFRDVTERKQMEEDMRGQHAARTALAQAGELAVRAESPTALRASS